MQPENGENQPDPAGAAPSQPAATPQDYGAAPGGYGAPTPPAADSSADLTQAIPNVGEYGQSGAQGYAGHGQGYADQAHQGYADQAHQGYADQAQSAASAYGNQPTQMYPAVPASPAPPTAPAYGQGYGQSAYGQQQAAPTPGYPPAPAASQSYGQPSYGQGYPTQSAPKKSKTGLYGLLGVLGVVVVAALLALGLAMGPLKKTVLDRGAVEQTIEEQASDNDIDVTDVSCPSGKEVKADTTFTCSSSAGDIEVTITTDDGDWEWTLQD